MWNISKIKKIITDNNLWYKITNSVSHNFFYRVFHSGIFTLQNSFMRFIVLIDRVSPNGYVLFSYKKWNIMNARALRDKIEEM